MNRIFGLRIGGIVVRLDEEGVGSIESKLHYSDPKEIEDLFDDNEQWQKYESAIDGLESLILGHACSGVDILDKKYLAGVQTAVDAIANNI